MDVRLLVVVMIRASAYGMFILDTASKLYKVIPIAYDLSPSARMDIPLPAKVKTNSSAYGMSTLITLSTPCKILLMG